MVEAKERMGWLLAVLFADSHSFPVVVFFTVNDHIINMLSASACELVHK